MYNNIHLCEFKWCWKISNLVLNCRSDERGIHVNELSRELKLPLDKIMSALLYLYLFVLLWVCKAFAYDVTQSCSWCQVVAKDSWRWWFSILHYRWLPLQTSLTFSVIGGISLGIVLDTRTRTTGAFGVGLSWFILHRFQDVDMFPDELIYCMLKFHESLL